MLLYNALVAAEFPTLSRVIDKSKQIEARHNEDRVERGTGFGKHSHAEFGIWSYIVNGELEHKDSMGNLEKLRRGEVQFTNAGTGIQNPRTGSDIKKVV